MSRILCIDYGLKRCGIAVTDPLQIIVGGLATIDTPELFCFLESYLLKEDVEKIVFGYPVHKDGTETQVVGYIRNFEKKIKQKWPEIVMDYQDEAFSSSQAKEAILFSGANRKKRQDKALVDKISAVIILQRYLKHI